jgi:hypothetical protein
VVMRSSLSSTVVRLERWVERGVGDPFGDRPLLDRPFDE